MIPAPDAPLAITHLDRDEIGDLSVAISVALQELGMKGAALDKALSAAFRAAIVEVQAARQDDERRRAKIRMLQ
jgi:hypothetical protein